MGLGKEGTAATRTIDLAVLALLPLLLLGHSGPPALDLLLPIFAH